MPSIAIIGAGIAGLSAAQKLFQNGFNEITIFEAMDRMGGRIHTIPFGIYLNKFKKISTFLRIESGVLELGAQWLHGMDGNPLYYLAKERDLISNPRLDFGIEGTGIFCTDSGQLLNNEDLKQIISYFFQIKDDLRKNMIDSDEMISVQNIFKIKFENYIESDECPPIDRQLLWSLFNWFIKFEVIDNSCDDMNEVSLLSYTLYKECEGIDLINFKNGFKSVIDSIIEDIPREVFLLETAVKRIEICDKTQRIKLFIEDKSNQKIVKTFDHVIITASVGFLHKNFDTFFGLPLPALKTNIIKVLGFGTVDKIYLYFDKPFWKSEDKGFQLIWTKQDHNLPLWVYDISGFDLVKGQPHVLVAWIGANGAKLMEQIDSDKIVGRICGDVLRLFLPHLNVDYPSKVIRSKWSTNPYICGSYSHRSLSFQKLKCDIEALSQPIVKTNNSNNPNNKPIDCPLVLFAGEATDRKYFSTTHGAMRSGHREAQRLIQFYQTIN